MIQIVTEVPDVVVAIQQGTLMVQIDRYHFDSRDGTVYVDGAGEGHQPPVGQGSDLILEVETISNVSGMPNDLAGVSFQAQFRSRKQASGVQAEATFTQISSTVIRLHVSAAATAAMTEPNGVWDMEASWIPSGESFTRTRRILEGRWELSGEVTR